jgi:hypothetical protein
VFFGHFAVRRDSVSALVGARRRVLSLRLVGVGVANVGVEAEEAGLGVEPLPVKQKHYSHYLETKHRKAMYA